MAGNMERIRKWYGVPARRGMRVVYTGSGKRELGTIRSARDCRLNIQLDGYKHTMPFHPTWELEYLPWTEREVLTPQRQQAQPARVAPFSGYSENRVEIGLAQCAQ